MSGGCERKGDSMTNKIPRSAAQAALLFAVAVVAVTAVRAQIPADFSFRSIDGETVSSESMRGQVVVLAVGAAWLPISKNQLEGVKKLADDYAGRGVAVYWVSTDSDSPKSRNYASDDQLRTLARKYKITVLRDPDGAVSKRLGVDQLPTVLIIDKHGSIAGGPIGGLDPTANLTAQLSERLKKIL
jgi:peroxiredoxin